MKKNNNLTNFRFELTEEMNNMFIDILISKQILEDNENLTLKEQLALKKNIDKLTKEFIIIFRKNNIEQIKKYNELIDK